MGMKVGKVGMTCHTDGEEKGEFKSLAEDDVDVLVFKYI
jgi:hypothetical protein